ncbi:MAG: metal-dependent hydrolase [Sphingosinicella sp.]|uniref:metal-dependent hydrolase n=1 Tax=Sphingosinicella sp. TaxID=1917971 RepID=UPI0040377ADE
MTRAVTPADLTITPRDRRFGRGMRQERWWMGGDPVATAFYNALSATFPKGEAFFVESVRAFRDGADPKLAAEIKAFTTQEVMHSREHVQFNKRALEAGYDLSPLEERVEWRLSITRSKPPIVSLAATMCLEHFTAILANQLLRNPRHLDKADPESAALWRWHAIEEIEHKGVAYDTWLHATRGISRRRRWKIKAKVMLFVTRNFIVDRSRGTLELLRQDGITGARAWARMLWFAWINPGMLRKVFGAWLAFFLPRFHPWNHDDRALIGRAESDYAAALMPEASPA